MEEITIEVNNSKSSAQEQQMIEITKENTSTPKKKKEKQSILKDLISTIPSRNVNSNNKNPEQTNPEERANAYYYSTWKPETTTGMSKLKDYTKKLPWIEKKHRIHEINGETAKIRVMRANLDKFYPWLPKQFQNKKIPSIPFKYTSPIIKNLLNPIKDGFVDICSTYPDMPSFVWTSPLFLLLSSDRNTSNIGWFPAVYTSSEMIYRLRCTIEVMRKSKKISAENVIIMSPDKIKEVISEINQDCYVAIVNHRETRKWFDHIVSKYKEFHIYPSTKSMLSHETGKRKKISKGKIPSNNNNNNSGSKPYTKFSKTKTCEFIRLASLSLIHFFEREIMDFLGIHRVVQQFLHTPHGTPSSEFISKIQHKQWATSQTSVLVKKVLIRNKFAKTTDVPWTPREILIETSNTNPKIYMNGKQHHSVSVKATSKYLLLLSTELCRLKPNE